MNTAKWYKNKPIQIQALQWTRSTSKARMHEFTEHLTQLDDIEEDFKVYDKLHSVWVPFKYDDWIIRGTQGEYYPCIDSVFKEKYVEA